MITANLAWQLEHQTRRDRLEADDRRGRVAALLTWRRQRARGRAKIR
ncbi:hypothetical protein ACWEOE_16105 [Amycolatopsis sp. NPDC004368]